MNVFFLVKILFKAYVFVVLANAFCRYGACMIGKLLNKMHISERRTNSSLRDKGEWCVVTGVTDGIGKGIVKEMILRGANVCLIGRNPKKLADVVEEFSSLASPWKTKMEVIVCNLDSQSEVVFQQLEADLVKVAGEGGIGYFVNNAGISYPSALHFDELEVSRLQSIVNLNFYSQMRVSQMVYKMMKERRAGTIVCVGSGAAVLPSEPLYAAYAAAKAGIRSFCENLRVEAAEHNVKVQCHNPLMVPTKLSKVRKGPIVAPLDIYCRNAVEAMLNNSVYFVSDRSPYLKHEIITMLSKMIPSLIWDKWRLSQTKTIRKRYLSKLQADKDNEGTIGVSTMNENEPGMVAQ